MIADFTAPGTGTGLAIYMPGTVPTGETDPITGEMIPYTWQNYSFAGDTQWRDSSAWWASNQITPIAFYQSGTAKVTIYDVYGIRDVEPGDVVVKLSGSSVKSITLIGSDSLNGLAIVISGATSVGSITDKRTAPGEIAFIASNTAVKSLQINSSIAGALLNGRSLGGMIFPSDIWATATRSTRRPSTSAAASASSWSTRSARRRLHRRAACHRHAEKLRPDPERQDKTATSAR